LTATRIFDVLGRHSKQSQSGSSSGASRARSVSDNYTDEATTAQGLLVTPEEKSLSFYMDMNINIGNLNNIWNYLVYLSIVMDICYRVIHSFTLLRSRAKVSSVIAPPADVRAGAESKKGNVKQNSIKTPDQAIARIITNPAFDLVFLIVFVFVFAAVLLSLYEPIIDQFYDNCYIVHTLPSNLNSSMGYNGSMLAGITMQSRSSMCLQEAIPSRLRRLMQLM